MIPQAVPKSPWICQWQFSYTSDWSANKDRCYAGPCSHIWGGTGGEGDAPMQLLPGGEGWDPHGNDEIMQKAGHPGPQENKLWLLQGPAWWSLMGRSSGGQRGLRMLAGIPGSPPPNSEQCMPKRSRSDKNSRRSPWIRSCWATLEHKKKLSESGGLLATFQYQMRPTGQLQRDSPSGTVGTGQSVMCTNWKRGSLGWILGRNSLLLGWRDSGRGGQRRLRMSRL